MLAPARCPELSRPRSSATLEPGLSLALLFLTGVVTTQQPPAGVALSGVVLDAGSSAPVGGAFAITKSSPGAVP